MLETRPPTTGKTGSAAKRGVGDHQDHHYGRGSPGEGGRGNYRRKCYSIFTNSYDPDRATSVGGLRCSEEAGSPQKGRRGHSQT